MFWGSVKNRDFIDAAHKGGLFISLRSKIHIFLQLCAPLCWACVFFHFVFYGACVLFFQPRGRLRRSANALARVRECDALRPAQELG